MPLPSHGWISQVYCETSKAYGYCIFDAFNRPVCPHLISTFNMGVYLLVYTKPLLSIDEWAWLLDSLGDEMKALVTPGGASHNLVMANYTATRQVLPGSA